MHDRHRLTERFQGSFRAGLYEFSHFLLPKPQGQRASLRLTSVATRSEFSNSLLIYVEITACSSANLARTMSAKRSQRSSVKTNLVWDSDTAIVFDPTELKL